MKPFSQTRLTLTVGAALAGIALLSAAESRRSNSPSKTPAKVAAKTTAKATAAGPSPGSFEAYSLILERNIFNPNRVGRTRATDEKAERVEELSLVGTVQHGSENLALFDGTVAAFRKAVHEGDTLGDFKVQRITPAGVDLQRGEQPFALKVAQQLRRVEGGDWTVATNQAARTDPRALAGPGASVRPVEAVISSSELPVDASEVLKRLMKQREKQLNK